MMSVVVSPEPWSGARCTESIACLRGWIRCRPYHRLRLWLRVSERDATGAPHPSENLPGFGVLTRSWRVCHNRSVGRREPPAHAAPEVHERLGAIGQRSAGHVADEQRVVVEL